MTPFQSICLKIERAKYHVSNLDGVIRTFAQKNPYVLVGNLDPNTGEKVFRLGKVPDLPLDIPLITGDVIHNLRSSLDHIAWAMFNRWSTDKSIKEREVSFPIYSSKRACEADLAGKEKMFGLDGIKMIAATGPYKGGHPALWKLHQLDLRDKHRLLITMSAHTGLDITPVVKDSLSRFAKTFPDFFKGAAVPQPTRNVVIPFEKGSFPAEEGEIAFTVLPGQVVNTDVQIAAVIALNEPGVAERDPLLTRLDEFVIAVDIIAKRFEGLV